MAATTESPLYSAWANGESPDYFSSDDLVLTDHNGTPVEELDNPMLRMNEYKVRKVLGMEPQQKQYVPQIQRPPVRPPMRPTSHSYAAHQASVRKHTAGPGSTSSEESDSGNYTIRPRRPELQQRHSTNSASSAVASLSHTVSTMRDSSYSYDVLPANARIGHNSWQSQASRQAALSSFESFAAQQPISPFVDRTNARVSSGGYQIPAPLKHRRTTMSQKPQPNEQFSRLPAKVLDHILTALKSLHLDVGSSGSCATCWQRDLCNIATSHKGWTRAAQKAMYENVQLVGADSAQMKKKYKSIGDGVRLVLLRRTLRTNLELANLVKSLKVPTQPSSMSKDEYHSLVGSVVMACPNLERMAGFHPSYNHSTDRFFYALASRRHMKDMTWVLDASPQEARRRETMPHATIPGTHVGAILHPYQSADFLELHLAWQQLETLTIHCLSGGILTPGDLVPRILQHLPALKTVNFSHMPVLALDDSVLGALPALNKLTISHCPGVTASGLGAYASSMPAQSLQTLQLKHQNIQSLPALARMLSKLRNLTSFTLIQPKAPVLPKDTFVWLMPYLASASIQKLHWDITSPENDIESSDFASSLLINGRPLTNSHRISPNNTQPEPSSADKILARSIAAEGFPALRTLRCPNDTDGMFQSLCHPRERVDLPGDRYKGGLVNFLANKTTAPGPASTYFYGSTNTPANTTFGTGCIPLFAPGALATHDKVAKHGSNMSNFSLPGLRGSTAIVHGGNPAFEHGHSPSSSNATVKSHLSSLSGVSTPKSSVSSSSPSSSSSRDGASMAVKQARLEAERAALLPDKESSNLHAARLAAQARLEAARQFPRFGVTVYDEHGYVADEWGMAGFIGDVNSKISYWLAPDAGAVDERGGVLGVDDLLADGGENLYEVKTASLMAPADIKSSSSANATSKDTSSSSPSSSWWSSGKHKTDKSKKLNKPNKLATATSSSSDKKKAEAELVKAREGCTGRWNTYSGAAINKKDQDRWWHTERGRWKGVSLA